MLITNVWLLSVTSSLFTALAAFCAIAACCLGLLALSRDIEQRRNWVWSALAALTVFTQLFGFLVERRLGHDLLAQLVSSAVLGAAGLVLTARYQPEAHPL